MHSNTLFRLNGALPHNPAVEEWLSGSPVELYSLAREWFNEMRNCGDLVTELVHDGGAVACIDDAAFAYVNVFTSHVNVGFFVGTMLDDPHKLLEGSGKRMRHVKLKPNADINKTALKKLVRQSYAIVKKALKQNRD